MVLNKTLSFLLKVLIIMFVTGNKWKIISGKTEGQSQVESSEFGETCNWCFPLDIHLASNGVQGRIN